MTDDLDPRDAWALRPLIEVARNAIRARLDGTASSRPHLPMNLNVPRPVFVTLKRPDGSLRGCIGTLETEGRSLTEAVARYAVLAATEDPRFSPVRISELRVLKIEVSVLGSSEPITSPAELDPAVYGLVAKSEGRRGVLLPGVDGVETVEEQLAIVRRKAGIGPHDPVELERFRVVKVSDGTDATVRADLHVG